MEEGEGEWAGLCNDIAEVAVEEEKDEKGAQRGRDPPRVSVLRDQVRVKRIVDDLCAGRAGPQGFARHAGASEEEGEGGCDVSLWFTGAPFPGAHIPSTPTERAAVPRFVSILEKPHPGRTLLLVRED